MRVLSHSHAHPWHKMNHHEKAVSTFAFIHSAIFPGAAAGGTHEHAAGKNARRGPAEPAAGSIEQPAFSHELLSWS